MKTLGFVSCMAMVAAGLVGAGPASAVENQTFVSALNGNDANAASSCPRAAPCRTIGVAINNTGSSGTVTMVDDGTYEPFGIFKYITIEGQGPGTQINNNNNGAAAIVIGAANSRVTLRNFSIDGNRLVPSPGSIGIDVQGAASVNIENVTIEDEVGGSTPAGIMFAPSSSSELFVRNVSISATDNSTTGGGIVIGSNVSGVTYKVSVDHSSFDQNARGIVVQGPSNVQLSVSDTTVANAGFNGIHVAPTAGTTKLTIKDSQIVNNVGNGVMIAPTGNAKVTTVVMNSALDSNVIGLRSFPASPATSTVSMSDSSASNNAGGMHASGKSVVGIIRGNVSGNSSYGLTAVNPAAIRLGSSMVNGNTLGLSGAVSSYGNNQLLGNTTQGSSTPVAPAGEP